MEWWDDTKSDAPLSFEKKYCYQQKCFVNNAIADVDVFWWFALSSLAELSPCDRRKLWVKQLRKRGAFLEQHAFGNSARGGMYDPWIMDSW